MLRLIQFVINIFAKDVDALKPYIQWKVTEPKRVEALEGYRKDLDKNFRSKMESNVYRYLIECHPDLKLVEYEAHRFNHKDGLPMGFVYTPDFRCTTHNNKQFYIEVCPVLDGYHRHNYDVMRKYRPDIKLHVVNSEVYADIKKRFSKKTRGWEY